MDFPIDFANTWSFVAQRLGKVECDPRIMGNRNKFPVLRDMKVPCLKSIAVEIKGVPSGPKLYDLNGELFLVHALNAINLASLH